MTRRSLSALRALPANAVAVLGVWLPYLLVVGLCRLCRWSVTVAAPASGRWLANSALPFVVQFVIALLVLAQDLGRWLQHDGPVVAGRLWRWSLPLASAAFVAVRPVLPFAAAVLGIVVALVVVAGCTH